MTQPEKSPYAISATALGAIEAAASKFKTPTAAALQAMAMGFHLMAPKIRDLAIALQKLQESCERYHPALQLKIKATTLKLASTTTMDIETAMKICMRVAVKPEWTQDDHQRTKAELAPYTTPQAAEELLTELRGSNQPPSSPP